ncbi:MAG TPA: SHOCT domain-containing protein [Nitrososphaerales archaeon]|nr:SHOCT domain-containing protein [Nitrososphaerales archaeon]
MCSLGGLLAVAIVTNIALWAGGGRNASSSGRADSAIQIIRERYAKGEITKDQYDHMRKDLGQ